MYSREATTAVEGQAAWRWHLLLTKPFGEPVAVANLERQGYHVYYPRIKERRLRRSTLREAISSLFPRYLFIRLNASAQSLAPVHSTLGVSSVVRFGIEYAVVPDRVVADLKHRADPSSGLHCLRTSPFTQGGTVRFIRGPLFGLDGIFESEDAQDRVVILLNLLGCESRVKVPADCIVPG